MTNYEKEEKARHLDIVGASEAGHIIALEEIKKDISRIKRDSVK